MTDEIKHLRNQIKIISKDNERLSDENKLLKIHDTFLVDRLDKWADKNFDLRLKVRELEKQVESLTPSFAKESHNEELNEKKVGGEKIPRTEL